MSPDTWPIGKVVGNTWTIQERLASGGFGTVYRAQHRLLSTRKAVIKRLHDHLNDKPELAEAFIREASTMDALRNCPYIVQVWDVNQSDDHFLYICMEFVEGGSLQGLLDGLHGKPLPVDRALRITKQILTALAVAHQAHILHLDVKPADILIQSAEQETIAKLADFGIAAQIAETNPQSRVLRGFGAAGYSPPEQIDGTHRRRDLDGRADLYALGMTLYRMLTGRAPFQFEEDIQWLFLINGALVPKPSEFREELKDWRGLDEFVLKLTYRNRDDRFATADEALRTLAEIRPKTADMTPRQVKPRMPIQSIGRPFMVLGLMLAVSLVLIAILAMVTRPLAGR